VGSIVKRLDVSVTLVAVATQDPLTIKLPRPSKYPPAYPLVFRRLHPTGTLQPFSESVSLEGSSAQVATDDSLSHYGSRAQHQKSGHDARAEREFQRNREQAKQQAANPRVEDALDPLTCRRCGLVQYPERMHVTSAACISALRDLLAER
jgi:hypothetical protein